MKWKHQKLEGCLGRINFLSSGLSNNFPAFLWQCHKIKNHKKQTENIPLLSMKDTILIKPLLCHKAMCLGKMCEISTVWSTIHSITHQILYKYILYIIQMEKLYLALSRYIFRGNNVLDGKLFHCAICKCRFLPVSEEPFGDGAREQQRIWSW